MSERTAPHVIKIGGSVLTGPRAYARTARWLSGRVFGPPLVAVVSAENGVTDRLLAEAEAVSSPPDPRALDLLWSTGELRSASLLALHLQAIGVPACALNAHQAGLYLRGRRLSVRPRHLRRALEAHAVAVVPGFLATTPARAVASIGRGGSDLSAVLLAAALGAGRCELIKDVPGYFTADPARDAFARHIPRLDVDAALAMAEAGCDLVQARALRTARRNGIELLIRTADTDTRQSIVYCPDVERGLDDTSRGVRHAICDENDSRGTALGA
jgi:aspartate kinase